MRTLALVIMGAFLFFVQAQVLPALFHTNFLPNAILTTIIVTTLFQGRRAGLITAIVGGAIQDILISNFFGLHLFPYIIVVYMLSLVKHRVYEERWYWTGAFVAICTLLDGIIRSIMINMSGGDISFLSYVWYMVLPTVFWNALLGAVGHNMMKYTQEREEYMW